jgi:hypothetical protein
MPKWTPEEQLAFDIAFALKKLTIRGFRKALKEEDRLRYCEGDCRSLETLSLGVLKTFGANAMEDAVRRLAD